jgi:UDP-N-acetylmuramate dehydrogenase
MSQLFESIGHNVPLAKLTTLGVGGVASFFFTVRDEREIPILVDYAQSKRVPIFVLGHGSNVVISDKGFPGLVIKMENFGIEVLNENVENVCIRVQAGLKWDDFVLYSVIKGWWGVENMSHIPGTVGASPVQNVGAYGQECKNVIRSVNAYDTKRLKFVCLDNQSCGFGFRESIFNTIDKDRFIISSVEFNLSKVPKPCLTRLEIREGLTSLAVTDTLQMEIRELVIKHRSNGKSLPNSILIGSAGTFYRTTVISLRELIRTSIKSFINIGPRISATILVFGWKYRNAQGYRVPSRMLIDACKASSLAVGGVELYTSNSAVIVTHIDSEPKAEHIIELTRKLRAIVYEKTGFRVPIEPTFVGFSKVEIDQIFKL